MRRTILAAGVLLVLCAVALADTEKAAPSPASATKVDAGASGTYESGKWKYEYQIGAKGTKSERRSGVLTYDYKPIEGAATNDRIKTPWGVMQYFGDPAGRGWNSGWLLKQTYDSPIDAKKGRLLADPETWTKRIAERKKALVDDLDNFVLSLKYYGPQDKPFYNLTLSVKPITREKTTPFMSDAVIDKETALKIIDWLAESGALGHADDLGLSQDRERTGPAGPCYVMTVSGGKMALRYDLGWEMPMLRELLRLRGLLNGDAAKRMDVLMGRLSGYIKEWTGKPYEPPK